jgi:hypothetical protein
MVAYTTPGVQGNDRRTFSPTLAQSQRVTLPLPPTAAGDTSFEMEVYARFMRHLRQVPNSRMEIKILSSIQFTADMLDVGDALVAKTLTDLGLRAPRKAFPVSFLDFADRAMQRRSWDTGAGVPQSVIAIKEHWDIIGEDRFAATARDQYAIYNEAIYAGA